MHTLLLHKCNACWLGATLKPVRSVVHKSGAQQQIHREDFSNKTKHNLDYEHTLSIISCIHHYGAIYVVHLKFPVALMKKCILDSYQIYTVNTQNILCF